MQFVLIARDATDSDALNRRKATRDAHLQKVSEAAERGEEIIGAAMVDEEGNMCGSIMLFDVESRERLDELIANDPYTLNRVWGEKEIIECKVAPPFAHLLKIKGN